MKLTVRSLGCTSGRAAAVILLSLGLIRSDFSAGAANFTLSDGNSSVLIDLSAPSRAANWTVDGQNQLNHQSFWYRVGGAGPVLSLDTIGTPTAVHNGSQLQLTYTHTDFVMRVNYSLLGGSFGSGTAGLSVQVGIQSLGATLVQFYDYADFQPGGSSIYSTQLGTDILGRVNEAQVTDGGVVISSGFTSAFNGQVAQYPTTLTGFLSGDPLAGELNGELGPLSGDTTIVLLWTPKFPAGSGEAVLDIQTVIRGVDPSRAPRVPEAGGVSILILSAAGCGLFAFVARRNELQPVRC